MYESLKSVALRLMRAPNEPPEPPAGSHASIEIYRASPRYLRYRLLGFWIVVGLVAFGLLVAFVAGLLGGDTWPLSLVVFLAVPPLAIVAFLAYFGVRIDYDLRYYIVTDRSLRVREGAWIVQEKTITYANVQNLRVVQGPLQRAFGIWSLLVDTAGGGGASSQGGNPIGNAHRIRMAGIEDAHQVRDLILGRLRAHGAGSGLGDPDDREGRADFGSPAVLAALGELRASAATLRRAAEARAR
jgi:membrane protein YdbS with pleckstrin-like domain